MLTWNRRDSTPLSAAPRAPNHLKKARGEIWPKRSERRNNAKTTKDEDKKSAINKNEFYFCIVGRSVQPHGLRSSEERAMLSLAPSFIIRVVNSTLSFMSSDSDVWLKYVKERLQDDNWVAGDGIRGSVPLPGAVLDGKALA